MENKPKLSIITVNYNNKSGLIDTAKSVVAQTWIDYEWIIIDGGSTDGSVDVIKEYAEKTDKLVYWCSEPDGGIYQGMNKGIEKANGEYCWFLNSGDYAYKDKTLEEIFADEFDEDIVCGYVTLINNDGNIRINETPHRMSLSYIMYFSLPHQGMLIRTKMLKELGGYRTDYKITADNVFCMEAIGKKLASYRKISLVFAAQQPSGISKGEEILPDLQEERKRARKEIFPWALRIVSFCGVECVRFYSRKIRSCLGLQSIPFRFWTKRENGGAK